jgi:hypothetical protein
MEALAKTPGFPHRGWEYLGCDDRLTADHLCQYCGKHHVRYVHELRHPDWPLPIDAGCVCTEKLTGTEEAIRWEREAKARATRKVAFMEGHWKTTRYGGLMRVHSEKRIVIAEKFGRWHIWINGNKLEGSSRSLDEAKSLAFDLVDHPIMTRVRIRRRSLGLN